MLTAHLCLTSLCCHQIGVEAVRSTTLNKPRKVVSADATQAGVIHSLKLCGNALKTDSSAKTQVRVRQCKLITVSLLIELQALNAELVQQIDIIVFRVEFERA